MRTVQKLLLATSTAPGVATAISTPAATSASTPSTEAVTTILAIPAPSSLPATFASTSSSSYQAPTIIPTTASEPDDNNTSSNKARSTLATKLGLGLGIPLLVLMVLGITACVHRHQTNRKRQRSYAQAPPFDFNAPEVPPVSAADLAARQDQQQRDEQQREQQEQQQRHNPPRNSDHPQLAGWGNPAGGGGGPYDDYQVGFVGPLGFQGYYQGYQVPWEEEEGPDLGGDLGSPRPRQDQQQHCRYLQQWDRGGAIEDLALHDGQGRRLSQVHVLQVPVIQVRKPEQVPPEHQRRSVRVRISGGLNSGFDEVSPLSSSGSGPPYARVSAISGPR